MVLCGAVGWWWGVGVKVNGCGGLVGKIFHEDLFRINQSNTVVWGAIEVINGKWAWELADKWIEWEGSI